MHIKTDMHPRNKPMLYGKLIFSQGSKNTYWKKGNLINNNFLNRKFSFRMKI